MTKYYFLNGEIMLASETQLHVSDLAITRGYGIFDFFRTSSGVPLFVDDHLKRFRNSGRLMSLPIQLSDEEIKQNIAKLILMNGFLESTVKMVLTGGYSSDGFTPGAPNFIIMVDEFTIPSAKHYDVGVKLITINHLREFPAVKSINYLTAVLTSPKVNAAGAIDALFHDGKEVSEVTRSNFFIIKDEKLITAADKILEGITRRKVLSLAAESYEVEIRPLLLSEIYEADEAFITSSTKRIMPVVTIDEVSIGDGKPGVISQDLLKKFIDLEKKTVA